MCAGSCGGRHDAERVAVAAPRPRSTARAPPRSTLGRRDGRRRLRRPVHFDDDGGPSSLVAADAERARSDGAAPLDERGRRRVNTRPVNGRSAGGSSDDDWWSASRTMSSASIAVELTATEGVGGEEGTGPATFATSSAEAALSGVLRGIELLSGERVGRAASLGREVPRALRRLSIVRKMTDAAPAPRPRPPRPRCSPFRRIARSARRRACALCRAGDRRHCAFLEFKLGSVRDRPRQVLVAPIAPTGEVPKEEPAAATAANARKMRRKTRRTRTRARRTRTRRSGEWRDRGGAPRGARPPAASHSTRPPSRCRR